MSKKLSLRIHRVKCVDETGGAIAERIGNDEIFLGGFAVNENAETVKIDPISIYPHFDDGDVKTFNPPKVFHTFTTPSGGEWPKTFSVGLILIERDAGGMVSAVKKITDFAEKKIKEEFEVQKANRSAVSAAAASGIAVVLLEALKIALPYIINFVKREIIGAFADEIFRPQLAFITIPKPDYTWSGSTDSAEKTVRFRDHSGIYDLTYDWKLS